MTRASLRRTAIAAVLVAGTALGPAIALANHPVLVEGEIDFDGDGLIGLAEDTDNATDRVFGTITAALGAANGAANQNGRVTIVTSGRFCEVLLVTGANGNVTVEAAPGVEANIDAVCAGDRGATFPGSDNVARQQAPGVIVDAADNRVTTLRNLVIRNWTDGVRVVGSSRVVLDAIRAENNRDHGIIVSGTARATITNSLVAATGFRVGMSPPNDADPGIGIAFTGSSRGAVTHTTVSGSFATGLQNATGNRKSVAHSHLTLFDNNPNAERITKLRFGD